MRPKLYPLEKPYLGLSIDIENQITIPNDGSILDSEDACLLT